MPVRVDPLRDLREAVCSNGAPSARNLLVTVFGDALLPEGPGTTASVAALAEMLGGFGVSERLVRTSLTRLVNDGLLTVESRGRRSSYGVAPGALELFRQADDRIYRDAPPEWDGSWTIVVIDGGEATAARRAKLRQTLGWAGLGVVAPNVMASPVVPAAAAAEVVGSVGGFENVLVSRSHVVEGAGTLGAEELARRCVDLDETTERYAQFVERFGRFDRSALAALTEVDSLKLRILLVASFRRIVLSAPQLPAELLPGGWIGDTARALAGSLYASAAAASQRQLTRVLGSDVMSAPPIARFDP